MIWLVSASLPITNEQKPNRMLLSSRIQTAWQAVSQNWKEVWLVSSCFCWLASRNQSDHKVWILFKQVRSPIYWNQNDLWACRNQSDHDWQASRNHQIIQAQIVGHKFIGEQAETNQSPVWSDWFLLACQSCSASMNKSKYQPEKTETNQIITSNWSDWQASRNQ